MFYTRTHMNLLYRESKEKTGELNAEGNLYG